MKTTRSYSHQDYRLGGNVHLVCDFKVFISDIPFKTSESNLIAPVIPMTIFCAKSAASVDKKKTPNIKATGSFVNLL